MFLSEINVYPIKSLGGISLKSSIVENRGLQFDRRWMLVDENNKFLTQREFPKMATVKVEILKNGLGVSTGRKNLEIPFETNAIETASVKVWSSRCRAKIYQKEINDWFSDVLQTSCKLVLMPEETRRKVSYFYAIRKDDAVSFADAYPILLIGEESLTDLNARLETPVPMNRFRPNLVVSGADAFAEDGWKQIKIGDAVFHVVKPCARCVITTIDQTRGEKQGVEPLKTLANYRIPKRSVKRKILFGQNLIAENVGEVLNVGDKIEVVETKNKPKFI
ncbi:MAG: MOSC domain-containing protein [Pyrinomonadaceae bacterium]|nr:MOSC domain-containing protein [Pyrinomonadaceae bacterium]